MLKLENIAVSTGYGKIKDNSWFRNCNILRRFGRRYCFKRFFNYWNKTMKKIIKTECSSCAASKGYISKVINSSPDSIVFNKMKENDIILSLGLDAKNFPEGRVIKKLPSMAESVDIAVVTGEGESFQEIYKALKRGGKLYIFSPAKINVENYLTEISRAGFINVSVISPGGSFKITADK